MWPCYFCLSLLPVAGRIANRCSPPPKKQHIVSAGAVWKRRENLAALRTKNSVLSGNNLTEWIQEQIESQIEMTWTGSLQAFSTLRSCLQIISHGTSTVPIQKSTSSQESSR